MKRHDNINFQRLCWEIRADWLTMAKILDSTSSSLRLYADGDRPVPTDIGIHIKRLAGITMDDFYLRKLTDEEIETAKVNFIANSGMNRSKKIA